MRLKPVPAESATRIALFFQLSVASRLLLAFLGISSMAVIAAAAAIYSFREIGSVLDRITAQRVPSALASQNVLRKAERIVTAAPALLSAATPAEHAERSHYIGNEMRDLMALLDDLDGRGADSVALGSMRAIASRLRTNLQFLEQLVSEHIVASELKRSLLRAALSIHSESQDLLEPWLQIVAREMAQSRALTHNSDGPVDERKAAETRLVRSTTSYQSLQRVQFLITSVSERAQQIASTDDVDALRVLVFRVQQTLKEARQTTEELDMRLQLQLAPKLDAFNSQVDGTDSIYELRLRELGIVAKATRHLNENTLLSRELTDAVDQLVAIARRDIAQANREVRSVKTFSATIMIGAVALSLVGSVLIVWLYVGRHIARRLTTLNTGMLAIAGGDLRAPITVQGADEIGAMGRAVEVFRKNTLERDSLLADKAHAAQRLEQQVKERTAELAQSVRELRALGDVSQAVNSTINLETVLSTIVEKAVQLSGAEAGTIYVLDEASQEFRLRSTYGMDETQIAGIKGAPIRKGDATVVDQAVVQRIPVQIADIQRDDASRVHDAILRAGFRALLTVPLLSVDRKIGALVVRRRRPGEFPKETVDLLRTFGIQSVLALQNARLFHEIEEKSRQIELSSQHKSQFVANMSHELRTPLAAVLGYAELLQEGIYGALPEKTLPILTRIRSNGKHLLGLINTVLDISKIEAGQFKLNIGEYALGSIVETVMVATESLAATKKLAFKTEVAKGLPYGLGDEQRLTQVLLNLVGNAIKFTDAGEVRIAAGAADDHFSVSVSDTGPGIPAEEREHIFEKFRQVDSSNTRAKGGTGLGLTIAREIVEMHGGRIWVESRLGQGSTFRMQLPVCAPITAGAT
jgi:signal transduction histidine kinase/HAMP domain-containing protein